MKRNSFWIRMMNELLFGPLFMKHPDKHSNYRYDRYVDGLPEGATPMPYEQWIEAYDAEWEARINARRPASGAK